VVHDGAVVWFKDISMKIKNLSVTKYHWLTFGSRLAWPMFNTTRSFCDGLPRPKEGLVGWLFNGTSTQKGQFVLTAG